MEEIWKTIPGLEDCYQASNMGQIRSVDRVSTLVNQGGECSRPIKGKIIKQNCHPKTGYECVCVCINGVVKTRLVHRLVAIAFHDNQDGKPQVNHKNGIKTDNRVTNLEWATIKENRQHAYDIGLQTALGEKNSAAKLTKEQVLEIRASTDRTGKLAIQYGISAPTICDIKKRRSWIHV